MKKIVLFLVFALSFVFSFGQYPSPIYQKPNNSYGQRSNRGEFDSTLLFATGCGVPIDTTWLFSQQNGGKGEKPNLWAIYGDSCGGLVYFFNPKTKSWSTQGGSNFDTTTIYQNLANKVANSGGMQFLGLGLVAARPVASIGTGLYFMTDSLKFSYSDGTNWNGIPGSGGGVGVSDSGFDVRFQNLTGVPLQKLVSGSLRFILYDTGFARPGAFATNADVRKTTDSLFALNGPGGVNTNVQYKDASNHFAGSNSMTFTPGNNVFYADTIHSKQMLVDVVPGSTKAVLQMRPATRPNSSNAFLSFEFDSTNNYDGVTDNVFGWANNLTEDAVRYNDTLPGMGFFIESWFDVPGGRQMEHIMDMVDKGGGNHRLLQLDMNADNGGSIWMYEGDSWQYNTMDGVPYFQFDSSGNFNYTRPLPQIIFGDPDPGHGQLKINLLGSGETTFQNYSTGSDPTLSILNTTIFTPSLTTQDAVQITLGAVGGIGGYNVQNTGTSSYLLPFNSNVSADGGAVVINNNTSAAAGANAINLLQTNGNASSANSGPMTVYRYYPAASGLPDFTEGWNPLTNRFEIHHNFHQLMIDTPFLSLDEAGVMNLNTYGAGAHDGTPVASLGLDATNNVVTFTPSGSGSSGVYVPTASNLSANLTSVTGDSCFWIRQGNVITVTGAVQVSPSGVGSVSSFSLNLPTASNLGTQSLWGSYAGYPATAQSNIIIADVANAKAAFSSSTINTSGGSPTVTFTFSYIVQ